jgi:hypothetical protein
LYGDAGSWFGFDKASTVVWLAARICPRSTEYSALIWRGAFAGSFAIRSAATTCT